MKARTKRPKDKEKAKAARTFGRNLRTACDTRNITAATLATRIGKSRQAIERMLAGEVNPDLQLIQEIADGAKIPAVELVRGL